MIIGEELGITSSNVEEMKGSNNPEVLRLLGVESDMAQCLVYLMTGLLTSVSSR